MTWRKKTIVMMAITTSIVVALVIFWIAWDIYVYVSGDIGAADTESVIVRDYACSYPLVAIVLSGIFGAFVGLLAGHWFWPLRSKPRLVK